MSDLETRAKKLLHALEDLGVDVPLERAEIVGADVRELDDVRGEAIGQAARRAETWPHELVAEITRRNLAGAIRELAR